MDTNIDETIVKPDLKLLANIGESMFGNISTLP